MKRRIRHAFRAVPVLLAGATAFAQSPPPLTPFNPEVPVRKALPVRPGEPKTDPKPGPDKKPEPEKKPEPKPEPEKKPVEEAPKKADPKPEPAKPDAKSEGDAGVPVVSALPVMPKLPDPAGTIRLSPQGTMRPDQIQLGLADGYYLKKAYAAAAAEYEKYLNMNPPAAEVPGALYRLGESYRETGVLNGAKANYEKLQRHPDVGDLAAPAAYRLGDILYREESYAEALPHYLKAAALFQDPKLVNFARYFAAECMRITGRKREAAEEYAKLVQSPEVIPFVEQCRMDLAVLWKELGRGADALKLVDGLSKDAKDPSILARATVNLGLWELEAKRWKEAETALKSALGMPGLGELRDQARLGLLTVWYEQGKYAEVAEGVRDLPEQGRTREQILQLGALALKQLGRREESVALFEQLAREFPDSASAREAAYQRLVLLFTSGAPDLVKQLDDFLEQQPSSPKRGEVQLMKAELLFKNGDYTGAAPLYAAVDSVTHLGTGMKAEALGKLAYCLLETRQYPAAVTAYTKLIGGHPQSGLVPNALCQRGMAKLRLGQAGEAMRDFEEVNSRFPKAPERELALYQKGRIQGQLNDNAGMAKTFKLLLKDFPQSAAAAEANYWIGWVAFERKEYRAVYEPLAAARKLDRERYFELGSLKILWSLFYLEDKPALGREIEAYQNGGAKRPAPYDIVHWLGQKYFESGSESGQASDYEQAARFLGILLERGDARSNDVLNLGRSQLRAGRFAEAVAVFKKFVAEATEPSIRALGLLQMGEAYLGLKDHGAAQKSAEEALGLQPDGELNAKARVLVGDIQRAQGALEEAAKIYELVGVVIDDESITPGALEKAVQVYRELGRDADAKKVLNRLQSRYPEYAQKRKLL